MILKMMIKDETKTSCSESDHPDIPYDGSSKSPEENRTRLRKNWLCRSELRDCCWVSSHLSFRILVAVLP